MQAIVTEDFLKKNIGISGVDAAGYMTAFLFYAPLVKKDTKIITDHSVDMDTAIRIIDYRLNNISSKAMKTRWNDLRDRLFNYGKANNVQ